MPLKGVQKQAARVADRVAVVSFMTAGDVSYKCTGLLNAGSAVLLC